METGCIETYLPYIRVFPPCFTSERLDIVRHKVWRTRTVEYLEFRHQKCQRAHGGQLSREKVDASGLPPQVVFTAFETPPQY